MKAIPKTRMQGHPPPRRHLGEIPRQTDPVSVTQGLELPPTEGSLRAKVWIEEPEEVGVGCWAQRRQAGLGPCTVTVNLEH